MTFAVSLTVPCNLDHRIQVLAPFLASMLLRTSLYCGFKRTQNKQTNKQTSPQLVKGFRIARMTCIPYLWKLLPQTSTLWNAHTHSDRRPFLECRANDPHPAFPGEPRPASLAAVQVFIWFVWLAFNSYIPLSLEISGWHTTPFPWGY